LRGGTTWQSLGGHSCEYCRDYNTKAPQFERLSYYVIMSEKLIITRILVLKELPVFPDGQF